MEHFWNWLEPLSKNPTVTSVVTVLISVLLTPMIATHISLRAFRLQAKELLDAAITWQWEPQLAGGLDEEPFLVIQNRSAVSAFLVKVRYRKGTFLRREAYRYALSYPDPTEGNFPLEVKAGGVSSFPLSTGGANQIAEQASWFSKCLSYIFKHPYIWVELCTISGHRMIIGANDVTTFRHRPLWLQGRWIPEATPDWMKKAQR